MPEPSTDLNPEARAWMLERLSEGGNWNLGRAMFTDMLGNGSLAYPDIVAGRNALAVAALEGCADSAYALGRSYAGPVGWDTEIALLWFTSAARLGSRAAFYDAAICAAHSAWVERRGDPKAGEMALGCIALALDEWPDPPQSDVLENLRVDILSLWPELEEWEFVAYTDQYQELTGSWH